MGVLCKYDLGFKPKFLMILVVFHYLQEVPKPQFPPKSKEVLGGNCSFGLSHINETYPCSSLRRA